MAPRVDRCWSWVTSLSASLSYAFTYFWRYPVFVLPESILAKPVIAGLDLHACLSLSFIGGFAAAKLPAAHATSVPAFFTYRLRTLLTLSTSSMLVQGAGLLLPWVGVQIASVFLAAFGSSFLWGMMITYLEGRQATEQHIAVATLCLIYAGNVSRGVASLVLNSGFSSAQYMPLVVGGAAWVPATLLLVLLDRAPRPTAADIAARCERKAMTRAERRAFVLCWAGGLFPLLASYALITGVRSLRDLYAEQIFAAALDRAAAPSWIFLVADLPGAVCSALALVVCGRVRSSQRALHLMLALMVGSVVLVLLATGLWQLGVISGVAWQLLLGTGLFVCYSVMGVPFFDRLLAATRTEGTVSFLVFVSDFGGYCVAISLLLYASFVPKPEHSTAADSAALFAFVRVVWACGGTMLILLLLATAFFRARVPIPTALHLQLLVSEPATPCEQAAQAASAGDEAQQRHPS